MMGDTAAPREPAMLLGTVRVGAADSLAIGNELLSVVNARVPEGAYPVYGLTDEDGRLAVILIAVGPGARSLLGV